MIQSRLDGSKIFPFTFKRNFIVRRAGVLKIDDKICFPGYIFIESEYACNDFIKKSYVDLKSLKGVFRLLDYGDKQDIALHEEERRAMFQLCNDEYKIVSSTAIMLNNEIRVETGPLKGLEHTIKKVNRHTREALIEICILGQVRQLSVSLEITGITTD